MNIDRELVNRALCKAGQEPLVDDDITKNTSRWRTVKGFYLATILEALSHSSWTCQKKRERLELADIDNLSDYLFCYRLPIDCAKPEALQDNAEFEREGNYIYTNQQDAVLMYISDGYIGKRYEQAATQPTSETFAAGEYYTLNDNEYTKANNFEDNTTYYIPSTDDFPEYDELKPDPMFSQYIETRLASKIVLKITGDKDLYQLLHGEAILIEQKATNASEAQGRSRATGNPYWGEQLGLQV